MDEQTPSIDYSGVLPRHTGGHYSLARGFFGACLVFYLLGTAMHAASAYSNQGWLPDAAAGAVGGLIPNVLMLNDGPVFVTVLVLLAAVMAALLGVGVWDRLAAGLIWYVLACLHWRNPFAGGANTVLLGWLLLAHILIPARPYGSWSARRLADNGAAWRLPRMPHSATWCLLAVAYTCTGIAKLSSSDWTDGLVLAKWAEYAARAQLNPLADLMTRLPPRALPAIAWTLAVVEISFAATALVRPLRPVVWGWTLVLHQTLIGAALFGQVNIGMLMLHAFCFDPTWVKPRASGTTDTVFYDARCGLCHRFVRFVLAEDWSGSAFRFATLDSRDADPQSEGPWSVLRNRGMIVRTATGRTLVRSTAILHVMHRLGGIWAVAADVAKLAPRPARDVALRVLLWAGRRVCRTPSNACPTTDVQQLRRFSPSEGGPGE